MSVERGVAPGGSPGLRHLMGCCRSLGSRCFAAVHKYNRADVVGTHYFSWNGAIHEITV